MYDTSTGIVIFIFGLFALFVVIMILYHAKNDVIKEDEEREEEKKVPTESTPTPAEPKKQSSEDEREALKREIIAELKGEDPKAQSNAKKPPVLAIVAICLLGAHILSQLGGTLELTGGVFNAGLMGYTIGALAFAIAALVLMIVDTVKRTK